LILTAKRRERDTKFEMPEEVSEGAWRKEPDESIQPQMDEMNADERQDGFGGFGTKDR
jgi:hypothetical protein